jgi:diguanylate cyclase (GGDEF)-like protein
VDLDGFKPVNDTYGHAAGDVVLAEVGRRLRRVAGSAGGSAARVGGDEFVVLARLDVLTRADVGRVVDLARELHAALCQPYTVGARTLLVGASVGVAVGRPGWVLADVLEAADAAMYVAKRSGCGVHVPGAGEVLVPSPRRAADHRVVPAGLADSG